MKIEAVIQPCKLDEITATLERMGLHEITISQVLNHSGTSEHKAVYRGTAYNVEEPRLKMEVLTSTDRANDVIDAIMEAARTSRPHEGTILMYEIADAVQIRTGARLQYTLA